MKLYKTDLTAISGGVYGSINMKFALCKKPDSKRYVQRLYPFQGCREELTNKLRRLLNSNSTKNNVDKNRTRLLIYSRMAVPSGIGYPVPHKGLSILSRRKINALRKSAIDKIMVGQKLVNHVEEKHGWLKTKYYKVDDGGDAALFVYMVVGSPRWQKSPHYLSLYTLLMRTGIGGFNPKSWEEKELEADINKYARYGGGHFTFVAKNFFQKVPFILDNQDLIIDSNDLSKMYSASRYVLKNNGFNEGIYHLLAGSSYDYRLSIRLKELFDKNNIDHTINNTAVKLKISKPTS